MSQTALLKTKVILPLLVLVIGGAGTGLWLAGRNDQTGNQQNVAGAEAPIENVSYQGEDGRTALELLKAHAEVQTQSSSYGEYVTSINGQDGGGTKYWIYYINDREATEGAGTYQTHNGETIEWRLQ